MKEITTLSTKENRPRTHLEILAQKKQKKY